MTDGDGPKINWDWDEGAVECLRADLRTLPWSEDLVNTLLGLAKRGLQVGPSLGPDTTHNKESLMRHSVLQPWVEEMPLRMQSTLILGLRGPDTHSCPNVKKTQRWLRGLAFKPGNPDNVAEFMGAKPERIVEKGACAKELEFCSQHFYSHLAHALEVVGYRHPDHETRYHAHSLFKDMCDLMHLPPETAADFQHRLRTREWPGGQQPDTFEEAMAFLKRHEGDKKPEKHSCFGQPSCPLGTECPEYKEMQAPAEEEFLVTVDRVSPVPGDRSASDVMLDCGHYTTEFDAGVPNEGDKVHCQPCLEHHKLANSGEILSRGETVPGSFVLRPDMSLQEAAHYLQVVADGRSTDLVEAILKKFPRLAGQDDKTLRDVSQGQWFAPFQSVEDAKKVVTQIRGGKAPFWITALTQRKMIAEIFKLHPELQLRCRYTDCRMQNPVIKDEDEDKDQVTCPVCREYMGLPPLE